MNEKRNAADLTPHPDTVDGLGADFGRTHRTITFESFEECAAYADRSGIGLAAMHRVGGSWGLTLTGIDAALFDLLAAEGPSAV